MLGTFALSAGYYDAYYLKAQKVRTLIRRDFEQAFESCDVIVTPAAPTTAFKLGEKTDDPLHDVSVRYLYHLGEPRGAAGHVDAVRLRRQAGCQSDCRSSARRSARKPFFASATPTSKSARASSRRRTENMNLRFLWM